MNMDSAVDWINQYLLDKCYQNPSSYPMDTAIYPLNNWGQRTEACISKVSRTFPARIASRQTANHLF